MYKKIVHRLIIALVMCLSFNIINNNNLSLAKALADEILPYSMYDPIEKRLNLTNKLPLCLEKAYISHIQIPDHGGMEIYENKLYVINDTYFISVVDISTDKMEIINSIGDFRLDPPYTYTMYNVWTSVVERVPLSDLSIKNNCLYLNAAYSTPISVTIDLSGQSPAISYNFLENIKEENDRKLYTKIGIPPDSYFISQIKDNKMFVFKNYEFKIVNISDIDHPVIQGNISLDYVAENFYGPMDGMLINNNYCYIITKLKPDGIYYEDWISEYNPNGFIVLDISDPTKPLLVGETRIPFVKFDKNEFRNFTLQELWKWWGGLDISINKLTSYNNYIFLGGEVGEYSNNSLHSHTRLYLIDVAVPQKPTLLGYFDFPYVIRELIFHDNFLYISTCDSIYKYDPSRLIPESMAIDSSQVEEEPTEVNISPPAESTTEETTEIIEEEPGSTEQLSQIEKSTEVCQPYWPLLFPYYGLMPYSYWPLSMSLDSLWPYRFQAKHEIFDVTLASSSIEPILNWYGVTIPFGNYSFWVDVYAQDLKLPADYPDELLPELLYHVYGVKIKNK